jgi:hypothetical protein
VALLAGQGGLTDPHRIEGRHAAHDHRTFMLDDPANGVADLSRRDQQTRQ